MKTVLFSLCRFLFLFAWSAVAFAQAYPNKPIKFVVAYPAGGGSDLVARTIGVEMAKKLGQPIIVDNRPGAAGLVGAEYAAKSPPDGYTMLLADNGVLIYQPALYKKLGYSPTKDFAPLGLVAKFPFMIAVAPNSGFTDARQFFATVKANPGRYAYATAGTGSPHHLAMELVKERLGLFLVHIPYRGSAPAVQDVAGGQVPIIMVDVSSGLQMVKAGKLIPLVVLSENRVVHLPNVPTLRELGYKDLEAGAWQGLVVPSSTPIDIQARLSREMRSALADPEVRKKLVDFGLDPAPSDADTMRAFTVAEIAKWHKLIKDQGITLE